MKFPIGHTKVCPHRITSVERLPRCRERDYVFTHMGLNSVFIFASFTAYRIRWSSPVSTGFFAQNATTPHPTAEGQREV